MQADLFESTSDKKHSIKHGEFIRIRPVTVEGVAELFYSFHETMYGEIIVGSSKKRVHWLAFVKSWREGVVGLSDNFPGIKITEERKAEHAQAAEAISLRRPEKKFSIYPVGTDFQVEVWNQLLKIPIGETVTYGKIAMKLKLPVGASRSVGTAVGRNPIAFLIPCHRVISITSGLGGYRWGLPLKQQILIQEKKA
ncbi:methylated-DNA--[protein]-cysteine S-methyltransferase [Crocinitomicaceae bacterium]|nr:methylated-DNA--[protein]-cysteine S-methyltransferase [Crocinitomicaceae bacterium]